MDPAEYEKMYSLEDSYWWFQGRKSVVARMLSLLPKRAERGLALDLGCGTGLMLEHLKREWRTVGLDFSPLALKFTSRRGIRRLIRGDAQSLPFRDDCFDLITTLDLMEHVPGDDLLLAEARRILKPGGTLFITAPAHPFLWSEHDDALYHCRRYRKEELRERVLTAGFEMERLTYCISFTFPAIAAFRFLQNLRKRRSRPKTHLIVLPRWANRLLLASVLFEAFLLKYADLPFGVTLLARAKKKELALEGTKM
jgi:SAM-dependent methyltransferase